jgi:ferric-dicitrate binding protein FerR (iron transport regulator)
MDEDRETLLRWLEENGSNRTKFCRMYDLWLYSNASLTDDGEAEMALARFRKRISGHEARDGRKPVDFLRSYAVRIAAAVLLFLAAGYAGYVIRDSTVGALAVNRLLTGEGGKSRFVLPDGSTVWLNANSTLEYPESLAGRRRMVRLEGEALFEVVKDAGKPFLVQSGGLDVEVTGTRFLVNNYHSKAVVEAMLVNGGIKISGDYFSSPKTLNPGQLVTYNRETAECDVRTVNTDDYTSWINPKLVFDRTNLANVIVNLKKWYGVEIIVSPELTGNLHMSFTIRHESLDEVLKYMSITTPVSYSWKGDTLYLSSKKITRER